MLLGEGGEICWHYFPQPPKYIDPVCLSSDIFKFPRHRMSQSIIQFEYIQIELYIIYAPTSYLFILEYILIVNNSDIHNLCRPAAISVHNILMKRVLVDF